MAILNRQQFLPREFRQRFDILNRVLLLKVQGDLGMRKGRAMKEGEMKLRQHEIILGCLIQDLKQFG
jgi:hypothetical protein